MNILKKLTIYVIHLLKNINEIFIDLFFLNNK